MERDNKVFKIIKAAINKSSVTDSLTRISNIDGFTMFAGRQQAMGNYGKYATLFFNVRNFKYYNRIYSYKTGSQILYKYAQALKASLTKKEAIGRLGGDNFIALVLKDNLDAFIKKLSDLSISVEKEDGTVSSVLMSSRAGIYLCSKSNSVSESIDYSSIAFGESRKNNRNDIVFYDSGMQEVLMKQRQVSGEFKNGLLNQEFEVYYQPKVSTKDHTLCGGEALVRWIKDGKVIPPSDFIPVLESEGSVVDLDLYVFAKVCKDIRSWLDKGIEPVRISSNFSRIHLYNDNLVDVLLNIMKKYNVDGKYLEFEITETVDMQDFKILNSLVNTLRNNGIPTSIDDFGSGYSSLSLVKNLDADVIKLDRSIIESLNGGSGKNAQFVKNVVNLLKGMGKTVLAEGVETSEQSLFITEIHCDIIQGYLFDKPLPEAEFEKRLLSKQY